MLRLLGIRFRVSTKSIFLLTKKLERSCEVFWYLKDLLLIMWEVVCLCGVLRKMTAINNLIVEIVFPTRHAEQEKNVSNHFSPHKKMFAEARSCGELWGVLWGQSFLPLCGSTFTFSRYLTFGSTRKRYFVSPDPRLAPSTRNQPEEEGYPQALTACYGRTLPLSSISYTLVPTYLVLHWRVIRWSLH